jgi:hypothetical protein
MSMLKKDMISILPLTLLASLTPAGLQAAVPANSDSGSSGSTVQSCKLAPGIRHVVEIQFDNVHLRRDNPNVPSDLEQMPNLLHFL